jgi:AcrR family transcriptional regulator
VTLKAEAKGEDRRVARTRNRLQDALTALIVEKGYDPITVQDILDRADVGRSTFYAHYKDKQDLLMGSLGRLKGALGEAQRAALAVEGPQGKLAFSLPMLHHVKSHARLYRAFMGRASGTMVMFHIQRVLADLARAEIAARVPKRLQGRRPLEAVVQATVGAYLALLTWWMDHGSALSAEEVDALFQKLVLPGLGALEG